MLAAARGAALIIHAGDVGMAEVLERLGALAPVVAVRGNVDHGAWAAALPATRLLEFAGRRLYLLHDIKDLDIDPHEADVAMVISGHSHQPLLRERDGVTYLNPGSCGPRRFRLPVSMARIEVGETGLHAALLTLNP